MGVAVSLATDRAACHAHAADLILENVDLFADWLASQNTRGPFAETFPRTEASFALFIDKQKPAGLMHIIINASLPWQVFAAREVLRDKYLEDQASYIDAKTEELLSEMVTEGEQ